MTTKKAQTGNTATVQVPRLTPQQEAERALRLAESDLRLFASWQRDFDPDAIYAGLFQGTPPIKLRIIEEDDDAVIVDYRLSVPLSISKKRLSGTKPVMERGTRFAYGRDHSCPGHAVRQPSWRSG